MPLATPKIKVDAVKSLGGNNVDVRLFGNNFDFAAEEAQRLVNDENMAMIHPFDDRDVISGQGTIGVEIIKATAGRPLDAIFVCCGGGGMLAGIAAYVKSVRPDVRVIGVEAEDAAGMTSSLCEGEVVTLNHVGLFADGAAVRKVGSETFRVCSELVDEMVTVTTDEICQAIKTCFNETRTTMEPAGALGVAGVRKWLMENEYKNKRVVAITSGANVDFDRLRFISERADASEALIAIEIPETPGSFHDLYKIIFPRNVTEFSYRYAHDKSANIILSFQARDSEDYDSVISNLEKKGFSVRFFFFTNV
jgi:threonine dehydratase